MKVYDPIATNNAKKLFDSHSIIYCDSLTSAIDNVQAVMVLTRWDEFKAIPEILSNLDQQPIVIDGRRMLDKHSVEKYEGIGL